MPTRRGASRTVLGLTCARTSPTARADLASPTTSLQGTLRRMRPTPGVLPSLAPLPALLNMSGCRTTISRIQPPRTPPLSASSSVCTRISSSTTTAPISRQQHNKRRRQAQAAALLPTRAQPRSLSPQAPRTTATANSFFRSSTASMRHSRSLWMRKRSTTCAHALPRLCGKPSGGTSQGTVRMASSPDTAAASEGIFRASSRTATSWR